MSKSVRYPCLPNWQRNCVCTLVDQVRGTDCAIEDKPKQPKKKARR